MTTTARHSQRSSWDSPQPYPQKRLHRNPSAVSPELKPQSPSTSATLPNFTMPPFFASPHSPRQPQTSPGYFNLKVEPGTNASDSDAVRYTRQNWSPDSLNKSPQSTAAPSPQILPPGANSEFEAFRRQSESGLVFNLSHGNLSHFAKRSSIQASNVLEGSTQPPRIASPAAPPPPPPPPAPAAFQPAPPLGDQPNLFESHTPRPSSNNTTPRPDAPPIPSFFDATRRESPAALSPTDFGKQCDNRITQLDDRHPRLSMPQIVPGPPSPAGKTREPVKRTETAPMNGNDDGPTMIVAQDLVELLKSRRKETLLLDVRVYPQYAQSRISGALNLCIPTTLLKRPSFNLQKLAETFTNEEERAAFERWRECKYIVVYDAASVLLKDAVSSVNTLKKFAGHGWHGKSMILRGGFSDFARHCPALVNDTPASHLPAARKTLSIASSMPGAAPVAGGCAMPASKSAANPFFSNIRQNMDLIGGVGQLAVTQPPSMTKQNEARLPAWLREASADQDQGKCISEKFFHIEKAEQKRMQEALSGGVHYGTPEPDAPKSVQIAGIEKGTKNRYNNIWPFDHSRVKLQGVPQGSCDYVNASYIKAPWSKKHYIATQAPIPATFDDFWRVVWEQNVRVIVMLTAEMEGGQLKCHPYWKGKEFGALRLEALSERRVSLEAARSTYSGDRNGSGFGRRKSTQTDSSSTSKDIGTPGGEQRFIIVRKFSLFHTAFPFTPMREITQLQYSSWPDFGAPAHPSDLLGLVDQCNAVLRATYSPSMITQKGNSPDPTSQSPILVHCSAGCGRTGTFCTVDSVIDMLKRQKLGWGVDTGSGSNKVNLDSPSVISPMDIDAGDRAPRSPRLAKQQGDDNNNNNNNNKNEGSDWKRRDDLDLVEKTVEAFRDQRLSMVQSLRQFVLCYESVLEWLVVQQQQQQQSPSSASSSSMSSSITLPSASAEHGSFAQRAASRSEEHFSNNQFRLDTNNNNNNRDRDHGAGGNGYFGFS
ncbi:hypothetical protein L228DRAFT_268093 [Xylona heveae TC161]|uniref:protein-tyrosine-phosphatase n=1 Tax=Xylona heveae (strain CBS 132557 / TC161) TaxID=1328760 RepID=A0A165GX03_XYLHT|nr:hypothetical protein L228DRAFT_268093 [Xylona heveae TC161]KZF22708.1 hypothetical protein L228DRAFT_268093 [Xylona heveae TC161]